MNTKTILLTGARAPVTLDLARSFYRWGCRVICVDSLPKTICTYSKCVDRYVHVRPPATDLKGFSEDLNQIISEEGVDLLIPNCEEALYIAKIKESLFCEVFSSSFELVESLHNKWTFYQMTKEISPETEFLKDKTLLPPYIVKPVYSRFAAFVEVIRSEKEIKDDKRNPKIVQRFIEGESYCSYAVVKNGSIRAYSIYKVLHSIGIGASMSSLSVEDSEIVDFMKNFLKKIDYSGQISFDFIRSKKKLYVIECNPRATSGVHLFDCNPNLAKAFFEEIFLKGSVGKIYHEPITMILYGIKQREILRKNFLKDFVKGKNVLFRWDDVRPLLSLPVILFGIFKMAFKQRKKIYQLLTEDVEYNGERVGK
ncbi:MAG: ATP-grasp domain-containing protein [Chlamydiia bacterium]|nr:ATP-grasp domain-containing protein [Chlamydiia bacterium]